MIDDPPVMGTLIIAEAGVNHNGDLELARRLIDAAADAGANVVKFQTFRADGLATRTAAKARYQSVATGASEGQLAMLQRLELDRATHIELIAHCRRRGIGFLSTAFDAASLELLLDLGATCFKIPTVEVNNLPKLLQVGSYGKPLLVSSGMSTLADIEAALDILERAGTPRERITVLQCSTAYPTPVGDVNLRAMLTIRAAFGVAVGYSDHTEGYEVALAAVALGASVLEKHMTLSRGLPGPDHAASLEPDELSALVRGVRNIELALGDGIKRPALSEVDNLRLVRKSIVARLPIAAGELFSPANLTTKRPGTGISPMRWDEVIGRPAPRAFATDELVEL
jgi:N,N'-diacetyllegionaminate synthase